LDRPEDGIGGEIGAVRSGVDVGLKLGIVLAERVQEKDGAKVVVVQGGDGNNSSVEGIDFVDHLAHRGTWTETEIESFGNEDDLCMDAVVLVMFAKSLENSGGVRKIGDGIVVGARYVLKHESFEGSTIDLPNAMTFRVGSDVRLREEAVDPISESLAVRDECHVNTPVLPVRLGAIEAEIGRP
jgi:hypothetical protein